jgi:hypothetical protein
MERLNPNKIVKFAGVNREKSVDKKSVLLSYLKWKNRQF